MFTKKEVGQQVEIHKPFVYKINYMLYCAFFGYMVCYMYVTGYGGTMPGQGSFYLFLSDCWQVLGLGAIAPIISAFVGRYIIDKKKRDRRSND